MNREIVDRSELIMEIIEKPLHELKPIFPELKSLKKCGIFHKMICPFHVERTPSFVYFDKTVSWRCMGCGTGGNIITYYMMRKRVCFNVAIIKLAVFFGIKIKFEKTPFRRIY